MLASSSLLLLSLPLLSPLLLSPLLLSPLPLVEPESLDEPELPCPVLESSPLPESAVVGPVLSGSLVLDGSVVLGDAVIELVSDVDGSPDELLDSSPGVALGSDPHAGSTAAATDETPSFKKWLRVI